MTREDSSRFVRSRSRWASCWRPRRNGCPRGGPHWASPDKLPARRLETIRLAGELAIPFTSGILIGIGETRAERLDALLALRALSEEFGHVQEVIVQNFRAKPGTRMAAQPGAVARRPSLDDRGGTAPARPGLSRAGAAEPRLRRLPPAARRRHRRLGRRLTGHDRPCQPGGAVAGGRRLREATRTRGLELVARLPVYPEYLGERWLDPGRPARACCAPRTRWGLAREDRWAPGEPGVPFVVRRDAPPLELVGDELGEEELRGSSRRGAGNASASSPPPTAFGARSAATRSATSSRGTSSTRTSATSGAASARSRRESSRANLRGAPYLVPLDGDRAALRGGVGARRDRGLPPGWHPSRVHGRLLRRGRVAIKDAVPGLHVHAFSALEVWQGAATLGLSLNDYLARLRDLGLSSLPGTAAEILDDEVRAVICPDKVTTDQWLEVHDAAHRVGLRSNVTIMFGHVERPRKLGTPPPPRARAAAASGGFTEFVPLPFVPMEAPIYLKGRARRGPTLARRCSSTRSAGSPCTRGSRTSRRPGSSSGPTPCGRRSPPVSTTSAGR